MEEKLKQLQTKLRTNEQFRSWLMVEWNALYNDILNGTKKYPYFYDTIEDEYNRRYK